MSYLESFIYNFMVSFRWLGIIAIAIVAMAVLLSEAAKEKLSPGKILTVTGSGVLAAVMFWILPTLVDYARTDADAIVPNQPIGTYR